MFNGQNKVLVSDSTTAVGGMSLEHKAWTLIISFAQECRDVVKLLPV